MAKSASQSSQKWAERAANAAQDFVEGAQSTSKDQAAAAIAAAPIYAQAVQASIARGAFAKGLQKSGKGGWLAGIQKVGAGRFAEGVGSSAGKYATNSAPFDSARNVASSMPRGLRGSPQNLAKVTAVVQALVKAKQGV